MHTLTESEARALGLQPRHLRGSDYGRSSRTEHRLAAHVARLREKWRAEHAEFLARNWRDIRAGAA